MSDVIAFEYVNWAILLMTILAKRTDGGIKFLRIRIDPLDYGCESVVS